MERAPKSDRPSIPGGYLAAKLLAWSWAETRLKRSLNYWVATVTPAGTPHARPVWGVWLDQRFFFSSGSRIRANVSGRSSISINLESGDECVIVEGVASELHEAAVVSRVTDAYNSKYSWNLEAKAGEFFEVRPRVAFAWVCDGSGQDGGALFSQTATRFLFEQLPGPAVLHHASLPVENINRAVALYDAALAALGYRCVCSGPGFAGYGVEDGKDKLALKQTAPSVPAGPGFHIALTARSRAAVDAFHEAALRHGASDNGPPGLRPHYGPTYYAAFIIDLDGHRIEAVHNPSSPKEGATAGEAR